MFVVDSLRKCVNGDVWAGTGPEIFWDDEWHYICGQGFWDNDIGATLHCNKRGSEKGHVNSQGSIREVNTFRLGKCNEGDTWPNCTGGCNDYKLGGHCSNDEDKKCETGSLVGVYINCTGNYNHTIFKEARCSCTYANKT